MNSLPVDAAIHDLSEALRLHSGAVLLAPPGAGKTTRVPLALLKASWLSGTVVMLEPRRLAAVNAACWMSSLLGESVGQTIGYSIRYERKVSDQTRVEVVTEGVLTRRLQSDPTLAGVSVVIFDEFHERNLHSDLALALCRDVQKGLRPDLKLIVMSATLDGEPVARLLGSVPVIVSCGKTFPVEIRYLDQEPAGYLPDIAAGSIQRILGETAGDLLVFLPGYREISRCQEILSKILGVNGPLICPLYADLPYRDQERAILPAARRKVVLATTIAETSLTIEGITAVIDCGWSRQPRFDIRVGLPRLETVRVSRAAADQRAGRAGRLGPGICYRLWTEHTHHHLIPFSTPEINSTDLSGVVLELALWGVTDPLTLSWLDPPPAAGYVSAQNLLRDIGALNERFNITALGRRMGEKGLHPRLARLLVAGEAAGFAKEAAVCAALLSESGRLKSLPVGGKKVRNDNDLFDLYESFIRWQRGHRDGTVSAATAAAVNRLVRLLCRTSHKISPLQNFDGDSVARLLVTVYPDRIAMQREPGSNRYLLANGKGCRLSHRSSIHDERFIVAVDIEGGDAAEGAIHLAAVITLSMIRELHSDMIMRKRRVIWNEQDGRVTVREEERIKALLLSEKQVPAADGETETMLLEKIAVRGIDRLPWSKHATQFRNRVRFCTRYFPDAGFPDLSDKGLAESLHVWLLPFLPSIRTLADLEKIDISAAVGSLVPWDLKKFVDDMAPVQLTVPSGSRIALDYSSDEPVLAVKLQELFGLAESPAVVGGKARIILHLLSPAGRPIQITRDLQGFWNGAYHEVKKELKGRYPKHPWPDDPWSALPTKRTTRRMVS